MASQGPLSPSANTLFASEAGSFTNISNMYASDNADAVAVITSGQQYSDRYRLHGFGFSDMHDGASIDGIEVEVEADEISGTAVIAVGVYSETVSTYKDTNIYSGDEYYSFGGETDTWGKTLTGADVKSSDFGVVVYVLTSPGGSSTVNIDHVRVTVYYTNDIVDPVITVPPTVSTPDPWYAVTFTATDDVATGSNELTWEVRTASGGGGNLVATGTATHNVSKNTGDIVDPYLTNGSNTRYLRVLDFVGNTDEDSFAVDWEYAQTVSSPSGPGEDGSNYTGSSGFSVASSTFNLGGYTSASNLLQCASWVRFDNLAVPPGATIVRANVLAELQYSSGPTYPFDLYFADEDDATNPTNATDFNNGPYTTVFHHSVNPASYDVGDTWQSDNLSASLQEVVDRDGWSSGNAVVLYSLYNTGQGTTTSRVYGWTYNSSSSKVPVLSVVYSTNSAPEISVAPSVNYGAGYNAVGPSNSATVTFTAEDSDAEDQSADALDWEVRTATGGGGTLIISGTCSHSSSKEITITNGSISSLLQGNTTLYLSVLDDDGARSTDSSFVIRKDSVNPTTSTSLSHTPDPVAPTNSQYTITFTPNDATTMGADELDYQIRTGASGTGLLLSSGMVTSGVPETTGTITDPGLVFGNNNRYIRVIDGAGNVGETTIVVELDAFYEDDGTLTFEAILTGEEYLNLGEPDGLQVIEAELGGPEYLDLDEEDTETSVVVLVVTSSGNETADRTENDGLLVMFAVLDGGDEQLSGFEEFGPELILEAVTSGTDQANLSDLLDGTALTVLTVTGGVDSLTADEESTAALVLEAVLGGVETLELDEPDGTQIIEVVLFGSDGNFYAEPGSLILEAILSGEDVRIQNEPDGTQLIDIITAATLETYDYAEGSGSLTLPVITTADTETQEMDEESTTASLIFVVITGNEAQGGTLDEFDGELILPVITTGDEVYIIGPVISYRTYTFVSRNPYDGSTILTN